MNKVSKKITTDLLKALEVARVEKDVENAYREAFGKCFSGCISSPGRSDGVLRSDNISALLEFKLDLDLRDTLERSIVIIQTIYYLKEMRNRGESLVKVVFIGDVNECFCIPTKDLVKYLDYDIDWSVAPSAAASKNISLVAELSEDVVIRPFVYDIDDRFDFQTVLEKMENISLGKPYAVSITKGNIVEIFRKFGKDVIRERRLKRDTTSKKISELADLFFTCLTSPNNAYLHPKKENIVVVKGKEVKVNSSNYRAFFSHFRQEYRPSELEELTANKDRVLEDTFRRRTGAFFTPQIWADEAHKMIAEQFGENWKEEYVVWDCAAGTANLTRGYKFKELYISSLDQSDIDTIKDCGYNSEAIIFQYDFLDEVGIDRVPEGLKKAFESGKKVLFFINPPYGTSKSGGAVAGNSKSGIAKTIVNKEMLKNTMGFSSRQLYCQFMYKISLLKRQYGNYIALGIFAPPLFMTSPSNDKFRVGMYKDFRYENGMLFQAGHFSDVSVDWGISFTLWGGREQDKALNITLSVKDVSEENYSIEKIGEKELYAVDSTVNVWVQRKDRVKGIQKVQAVPLTCAIKIKSNGESKLLKGFLGSFFSAGNASMFNGSCVSLFSSGFPSAGHFSTLPTTFRRVVAFFTARKTIMPTWINCKDEYLIPNTEHPDYEQWNNDAIVYSLFNGSSQQSSLRNIDYKDKKWDIKNEFFFMSNEEMWRFADDNNFGKMYQDAKTFDSDRYVYNLLRTTPLSEDAQEVLSAAKELVRKSMKMRKVYHENNPKYHLNAWDAGWAQLKPMLKQYYKEDYDRFVQLYKKFEDRMREGVYKFGWLRRPSRKCIPMPDIHQNLRRKMPSGLQRLWQKQFETGCNNE